jgi:energy-coupling factor transporter ATP-binding protein EcfA2
MPPRVPARAQASEVNYELHSLGWKAFQQLCVSVVSEVWGQTVQGFFDSHDGGRDGAFYGTWTMRAAESLQGSFTVQCKFTSQPASTIQLSDLRDELTKAERLAARGLADNYLLLTNARLTGVSDERIREAFESIPGIKHFVAYGAERISQFIRESPRLRMLVPRVYGLGDLSQILDERAYAQAQEILSALGDDLAKFVITDAYQRSAKALVEHGFVLLLGEPACGKSTIAAALAVAALDEWGCSTVKIRDADDFVRYSNPHEPKQFFWVDDAFGVTQLDWSSTVKWNGVFPHVHAAIRRGARVVFTSRDYIYRSARNHLKESAFPLIHESQVVINVERLTKDEREQILYNHIRLGTQPSEFKTRIKPLLVDVASHQRFSPEIARRLGSPLFTKNLTLSKGGLDEFVAQPMELLQEIIRTLDAGSRSALAIVFMRGGMMPSPMRVTSEEEKAITLLGGSQADVREALSALEGSLLSEVRQGAGHFIKFKHPTIRDAFASLVAEDRELLDIYLAGTPIEKLFSEVSCGDVGIEGVKVIVPPDRYEALLTRIEPYFGKRRENEDRVNRFLSYRCDKEFLALYIARNTNFVANLRVGSYLYAISDVDVIVRLNQLELLPESKRLGVVSVIRDLAVDTPDSGFLREEIRQIFTQTELDELLDYVKETLLPNLEKHIDDWRSNYDGDYDPDDHFSDLKSTLKDYREVFDDDIHAVCDIDRALDKIDEVVEELRSEMPAEPDSDDFFGGRTQGSEPGDSRSVFDDVDA